MKRVVPIILFALSGFSSIAQTYPEQITGSDFINQTSLTHFAELNNSLIIAHKYGMYSYAEGGPLTKLTAKPSGVSITSNQPFYNLAVLNNEVYFLGTDSSMGIYHWNGKDSARRVNAIPKAKKHASMCAAYGKLFFGSETYSDSTELNVYDPISKITTCAAKYHKNIASFISEIVPFNNKIYFVAGTIYEYDPVTNLTIVLPSTVAMYGCINMQVFGNKLFFNAAPGTPAAARQLCVFDGSSPAGWVTGGSDPVSENYVYMNGKVYFLKKYLSTSTYRASAYNIGDNKVTAISNIAQQGDPEQAVLHIAHNNKIYFSAGSPARKLYTFDGNNTVLVSQDIIPSYLDHFIMIGDIGYFCGVNMKDGGVFHFADWSTSVETVEIVSDILYPNPTNSTATLEFNLKSQKQLSFTVTDAMGRVVIQQEPVQYNAGKNKLQVNMESYAAGMYYFSLRDEHHAIVWSGKLVKE